MSQPPKGPRPTFFEDPASDRIVAIVTALSAEVAVLLDRMDTMEVLASRKGMFEPGEIDAYQPSPEEMERRRKRHAAFISRVFYVLEAEAESPG